MQKFLIGQPSLFAAVICAFIFTGLALLAVFDATGETSTNLKRLGLGFVFIPLFVFGFFGKPAMNRHKAGAAR